MDFLGYYPSLQQPGGPKGHEPWDQKQGLTVGCCPVRRLLPHRTAGSISWTIGDEERVQHLGEENQLLYNCVILSKLPTFSEPQFSHQKTIFLEQDSI